MATTFQTVANNAVSTLATTMNTSVTTAVVQSGAGALFPASGPFHITIESEILICTSRSGDTLTVSRSAESTTAASHTEGTQVALNIISKHISDLNTAVNALEVSVATLDGTDIIDVIAGVLLDGGGTTGSITLDVDLSELATSTTDGDGDYFVVVDSSNAQNKLTKANIALSGFNNDSAFITAAQAITAVEGEPTLMLGGAVTVTGNLTVNGTTTTVDTETLSVEDPLIALAINNDSADVLDIGIYGLYDTTGSLDKYSGLFRDATDEKWKLFQDLQVAPTTTVNTSGTGYAVGTLVANLEGNVTGALTGNADTATLATTVTVSANNSTDATFYPTFVDGVTGTQGIETDTGLTYNSSTGVLTSTTFTGNLTGNVTGNADTVTTNASLTGMVTSSGNATTVVTNASLTGHVTSTGNATILGTSAFTKEELSAAVSDGTVLYSGDAASAGFVTAMAIAL